MLARVFSLFEASEEVFRGIDGEEERRDGTGAFRECGTLTVWLTGTV